MNSTSITAQSGYLGQARVLAQAPSTDALGAGPNLRTAGDTVPLPWDNVSQYLSGQGMRLNLEHAPRQFAGGLANLNYLVEIDGTDYVLRRPPLGEVLPGANDMAREHRVLQALAPHYPYAPRSVLYCDDDAVMGAHFQIMEYRSGRVISGAHLPPDIVAPAIGQKLAGSMVDLLVQLHALDPAKTGLGDLGKPEGFLARAVSGWTRRAELASKDEQHQSVRFISAWLEKNRPDPRAIGAARLGHVDPRRSPVRLGHDAELLDRGRRPTSHARTGSNADRRLRVSEPQRCGAGLRLRHGP